jgi:hypothetical protein
LEGKTLLDHGSWQQEGAATSAAVRLDFLNWFADGLKVYLGI